MARSDFVGDFFLRQSSRSSRKENIRGVHLKIFGRTQESCLFFSLSLLPIFSCLFGEGGKEAVKQTGGERERSYFHHEDSFLLMREVSPLLRNRTGEKKRKKNPKYKK